MTQSGARSYELQALTDIWTGDANTAQSKEANRLIPTGLLGSVRWWFEVLVRGLGGSACDPSRPELRCPDRQGRRCVVCELFGCTGWARKFRFDVRDANGGVRQAQIEAGERFAVAFTETRPTSLEEWKLLDMTLRLIADYAAIGGKTVYKPSDENARQNAAHHRDYGVISVERAPNLDSIDPDGLRSYVGDRRWRWVEHAGFAWASLANLWSVTDRYLARQDTNRSTFNRVIGRPEPKRQSSQQDSWLAGRRAGSGQQPESKKVFSVKNPPRTFGFTNGDQLTLDAIKTKLRSAWPDLKDAEFKTGDAILDQLLRGGSA